MSTEVYCLPYYRKNCTLHLAVQQCAMSTPDLLNVDHIIAAILTQEPLGGVNSVRFIRCLHEHFSIGRFLTSVKTNLR